MKQRLGALGLLGLLTACQPEHPVEAVHATPAPAVAPPPVSDVQASRIALQAQFVDEALGVAILPLPGFTLRRDFRRDYLATDDWKAFAEPDSRGKAVAALVLDGSNEITAAELRLGVSDDPDAVAACLKVSDSALPSPRDEIRIDGQPFQHFRASDAAMSHYLTVDAYRAVRQQRCYAIDLLVVGTRPEVYDPPRTPPFDTATAQARLREALGAIRFVK
ncbi:hypothetical protein ACWKWK_03695 [Pseudoxanthomonas beigongshangi]